MAAFRGSERIAWDKDLEMGSLRGRWSQKERHNSQEREWEEVKSNLTYHACSQNTRSPIALGQTILPPEWSREMWRMGHCRPLCLKVDSRASHTRGGIYVSWMCSHGNTPGQNLEGWANIWERPCWFKVHGTLHDQPPSHKRAKSCDLGTWIAFYLQRLILYTPQAQRWLRDMIRHVD